MELEKLVKKNRSYRRFDESIVLDRETLEEFIETARYTASAANLQQLRFYLSSGETENAGVFETLSWAGYLENWPGPAKGERPGGYIVILTEKPKNKYIMCDAGITCQTILLSAVNKGYGGCIFGSIDREKLYENTGIDRKYSILLVIALGKPVEQIVTTDINKNDSIKYYRDEQNIHFVPKLRKEALIINEDISKITDN